MKRDLRFGAHVGTASMLLIFMTLALVSFAALSLAGAQADERLSRKLADHAERYFSAVNEAEAFLAATDKRLGTAAEGEYEDIASSFSTAVTENQELVVELELLSPKAQGGSGGKLYRILSWRTQSKESGEYTRHLPVSGGGGVE